MRTLIVSSDFNLFTQEKVVPEPHEPDSDLPVAPIKRYQFSPEIIRSLRPCFERDNWHTILWCCWDWAVIAGMISLSMWSWGALSLPFAIPIYLFTLLVVGSRQRALAALLHDATHKILAKNKVINYTIGTFGSGYLVLQSFTGYLFSHVKRHHPLKTFGHPIFDPDYAALQALGLYGDGLRTKKVRRYLLTLMSPINTWKYLAYLLKYRILPEEESSWERGVRLAYIGLAIGLVSYFGYWPLLLAYWVVPMLTTSSWVGSLIELAEHYPYLETAPRVDIFLSRNRLASPVTNFFLGIHYEGYHQVHHLFPGMPSYHYAKAHKVLLQDQLYASLNSSRGWGQILKEITLQSQPYRNYRK
jgi:fatty acid desaturase